MHMAIGDIFRDRYKYKYKLSINKYFGYIEFNQNGRGWTRG